MKTLRAGFAEIDITPPVGTHKIGWIIDIVSDRILDPLYARAAVFESGKKTLAFVQLDTLSVRWTLTSVIRKRIQEAHRYPGNHIMVSASHNHAGPAVSGLGRIQRDEAYVESLIQKCVEVFGAALNGLQDVTLGFNHVYDFEVAHNRRILMRDGTVKTHGSFVDPKALCFEGPIDPEVAVLMARDPAGRSVGGLVNYACHPTHHGGGTELSGGYPAVLAREMKARGCPVTLFLNGACGNTHTADPATGRDLSKEEAGRRLAADAERAVAGMQFHADWPLATASATVNLPYRRPTKDQVAGTAWGAQRFVDPSAYDQDMPRLLDRIRRRKVQPAEVQVHALGPVAVAGIPAEYFVEHGLRIKEEAFPAHALVASETNGMVGYLPTKKAFEHGGYETTFGFGSRMAPQAGDILADTAIGLIKALKV